MRIYFYGKSQKMAEKKRNDFVKKLKKRVGVGVTNLDCIKDEACLIPDYKFQAFVDYSMMAGSAENAPDFAE